MTNSMEMAVTIDLIDKDNGERWTRSRAYQVPRGLHIGRLMDELDDTVQDARRIVLNKQRLRREADMERISQEGGLAPHAETEGAEESIETRTLPQED